jgi:hypothetical protein
LPALLCWEGVMKTFAGLFATIVIMLTLAGTVPAAPMPDSEPRPRHDGALPPGEPRSSDTEAETPRVVTGRVLRVNAQEGTIVIQPPIGVIALRGPKEDLADVNVGDLVQVEMVDGEFPSASPRMDPSDER